MELRPCNIARLMTAENNHYISRLSHLRLPKICVAVTGSDANEMVEKAEVLARDNPFIEFRLDYLSKPGLALPKLKEFMDFHPHVVSIATCRRVVSGGKFPGTAPAQMEILGKPALAGCQLVDVEIQTPVLLNPAHCATLHPKPPPHPPSHTFRPHHQL